MNTSDTILTKEIYNNFKNSGKKTFDWIKEKVLLNKPNYQKRIISLEAKTNLFAGLMTPCILCLLIIFSIKRENWNFIKKIENFITKEKRNFSKKTEKLIKYLTRILRPEFIMVLIILIINYFQFIKNIENAEPNCIYTSFYNLCVEERKTDEKNN